MKKKRWKSFLLMFMTVLLIGSIFPVSASAASKKPTPGKVTLTKISAPAYNKITINWKKTSNATEYRVYYKKPGKSWTKIASVKPNKTSYTHKTSKKYPIVVGQKYSYTVRAYNSKSKKMGSYNKKGLTTKTIPSTVKLKKAVLNKDGTVTISWEKASGCNYYHVFQRSGSKWIKLASVKSNVLSYTDDYPYDGETNTYTVRAYYSKTDVYGKYNTKGVSVYVPPVEPEPEDPEPDPSVSSEELARQVVELTNQERIKYGKAPLVSHPNLQKAAMVRAKELEILFSHKRPNGSERWTALWEAGAGHASGENIADGQRSPEAVVTAWMNSSGHRAAILQSNITHIGVGHYRDSSGRNYWVQVFSAGNPDDKATITFDAMGGTINGNSTYSMTVPWGQIVYMKDVPVPVKAGYTFGGWSWHDNLINSIEARKNQTLTAEWK